MQAINLFVAIFIAIISLSVGIPVEHSAETNGGGTIQLTFLGTVDAKSYFFDNELRDWYGARTFCTTTGMHLASITSEAQWDVLAGAHNASTFDSIYWTSLRDSHEPRQFAWDLLETEPSTTIGIVWDDANNHVGDAYYTCVSFNSNANSALLALNIDHCSTARRVLCET